MFVVWSIALGVCFAIVIFYDVFFRRVPNLLLAAMVLAHIAFMSYQGYGLMGLTWSRSAIGLLIGLVSLLPFYIFRVMGAGDVKLFGVIGLLLGPTLLLPIWIFSSLLAGVHAIVILIFRGKLGFQPMFAFAVARLEEIPVCRRIISWRSGRAGIPYAAYLSVAAIGAILLT